MGSIDVAPRKLHILAFPYPGKGHINPMLHLCKSLAPKGVKVTMIHTTTTMKSLKSSCSDSSINIEVISDEHDKGIVIKDVDEYLMLFRMTVTHGLSQLIDKYNISNYPPTIILYDSTMPWVLDVAHGHGLGGASFFTQSLSVSALYYHMLQGTIKKDSNNISLPAMPSLETIDLPNFKFRDIEMAVQKLLLDQFSNIDEVDYILFNTFDKLENEVSKWMASKWPVITVGPTVLSMYQENQVQIEREREKSVYLFETNSETCLKWLDAKETCSVIYVSFGSTVSVVEEQLVQIAQGLANSGCPFLWVVRKEEESKLPQDVNVKASKKGLIVHWCPQLDVLAHKAVACFMTHCGWNSTLEALSFGVPMIAVPQWVDQTTHSKFIADVWHVGVRAEVNEKGIVISKEIERCITKIVKTENGRDLKRNAIKWKTLAKEAVEGGSSARNIQDFVSVLVSVM